MKKLISGDGSVTFHSEELDESYHSRSGALEESMEKYVKPAHIHDGDKVLDVCFGIGYNSLCALQGHERLEIVALEKDLKIVEKILTLNIAMDYFDAILSVAKNGSYDDGKIKIRLVIGDALETVKDLPSGYFDAVLFDPFSPKKAPEMWTESFFSDLFRVMKKGGRLTTYSCARVVRDNLKAAGFEVSDGPCVGRRSPSTIAVKP